ncbi:hypothetical protein COOONC_13417 [Cooperia oncophora]
MTFANMVAGIQNRSLWIDDECTQDGKRTQPRHAYTVYNRQAQLILSITWVWSFSVYFALQLLLVSSIFFSRWRAFCHPFRANSCERRLDDKHVLRRHKYVVVIGTVIGVYSAYLTAYATIQVLQLVNISE